MAGSWPFIPVRECIAAKGASIADGIDILMLILLVFNMPEKTQGERRRWLRLELQQGTHFHDRAVAVNASHCSPRLDPNSEPTHFAAYCCSGQVHNQKSLSAFAGSDTSSYSLSGAVQDRKE